MSLQYDYAALSFEQQVSKALAKAVSVLDIARNPRLPKDVAHSYDDKYALAEFAVKSALASVLNALDIESEHMNLMKEWSKTQSISLEFSVKEKCSFLRTAERNDESNVFLVEEKQGFFPSKSTAHKTVTKITEHFWNFESDWEFTAYAGTGAKKRITFASRKGGCEIKTVGKKARPPYPKDRTESALALDFSWFMKYVNSDSSIDFWIDRTRSDCHTPRRNDQTNEAIDFFQKLFQWSEEVKQKIRSNMDKEDDLPILRKNSDNDSDVAFSPILAMFTLEEQSESPVLSAKDFDKFLSEHMRQVQLRRNEISKAMHTADTTNKLNTVLEMQLKFAMEQCGTLCRQCSQALETIELMLRRQVVAAIGKEVSPADLTQYMEFHCRRLFKPEYQPKGFCYAVRRPDHFPDGAISIEYTRETASNNEKPSLIQTVVHSSGECEPSLNRGGVENTPVRPMSFALDAATNVSFGGERHLHACVLHKFSRDGVDESDAMALQLRARARQFSSFILVVGKIASAEVFEPVSALIVRDKDDLKIPLLLETMPTPKEFKDAIESLSPEQQRFCRAFRAMQLASTLFGICVIQIKPQMEKLLNLPPDSLTKEIQLTSDLMDLFIKYQIPSDLISYCGDADKSDEEKLSFVKKHVAALLATIANAKEKELEEEKLAAEKAKAYKIAQESYTATSFHEEEVVPECAMYDDEGQFNDLSMPVCFGASSMMGESSQVMRASADPPKQRMSRKLFKSARQMSAAPTPSQMLPPTHPTPIQSSDSIITNSQLKNIENQHAASGNVASSSNGVGKGGGTDYTLIPGILDKQCEALDDDNALRPTTIKTGDVWNLKFQKGFLSKPETRTLILSEQNEEKSKAFDLLDALSRSGELSIDSGASLHVVLAATHCFDKTIMDTIVQGNMNPIERIERSLLIVAGVVHDQSALDMLNPSQVERIQQFSPQLLPLLAAKNEENSES